MSQYTELLELKALSISPNDDDYERKLLEVLQHFRTFDDALTTFISDHGYTGDTSSIDDRVQFLEAKFNNANIPVDKRTIKSWFIKHKDKPIEIKPETAFQICFAFHLDIEQTNDFFRRVCMGRGFDCHTISGAVYYYCFRNGLSYAEAQKMLAQIPEKKQGRIQSNHEVSYTETIVNYIESVKNKKDLIQYINDNSEQFGYNNATATKYFKKLWSAIASERGLAYEEGKLINNATKTDSGEDDYVTVTEETNSDWIVYCQILGLDEHQKSNYGGSDRTIKSVLKDNPLLHPSAKASFPDRDGISKIINGEHISNERLRKQIILLGFYLYWAKKFVDWAKKPASQRDDFYKADGSDAERCCCDINKYLLDAGYQSLYHGNPYDWIFMWAMIQDDPLDTFRSYIRELFAVNSEQVLIKI